MNYEDYYKAILCDCNYDEESNVIGNMCKYCKEKDDIARENEWYEEIKTIQKLLLQTLNTPSNDRIPLVHKLFEYILTIDKFMSCNSNFRNMVKNKIKEFKLDKNANYLIDILNKTEIYLEELKNNKNYKN